MKKLFLGLLVLLSIQTFSQNSGDISRILNGISTDLFVTGQSGQSTLGNNILLATAGSGSFDAVSGGSISYRSFYVQVIGSAGISAGQIIFEGSNDNTTFNPVTWYDDAVVTAAPINAATAIAASTNRYFSGKITYRYFRCRISTAFVGGTVQALVRYSSQDYVPRITTVGQATAANLNATVSATNLSSNVAQVGGTNTVNGGVAGTLAVGGNVAHSAASTANPLQAGGRVVPTTIATTDVSLVAGDVGYIPLSSSNQSIYKQFSTGELDFNFNFTTAGSTTTVQQFIPASGTASVRNYISGITCHTDAIGSAGNVLILDGALTISSIAITTGLVTTSAAHDLKVGDAFVFTALAGGTGVTANQVYYVTSVGSTTTFNFAATQGGSNVVPSVAYTGTTGYRVLWNLALRTAGIDRPMQLTFPNPIRSNGNVAINVLIPTSLTSGNIYFLASGYRGF